MKGIHLLVIILSLPFYSSAQTRYYVNSAAQGGNTGVNWQDAFSDLQMALSAANSGDTVWVATGTYLPTQSSDREISFEPKSGVTLLGGFKGDEGSNSQRDWKQNLVVLSGDIGIAGDSSDNSYTIMYLDNPDSSTVVDGFIFRLGNAFYPVSGEEQTSPKRSGAGMYIMGADGEAYAVIQHCRFERNRARGYGGAVYINGQKNGSIAPQFLDCVFVDNSADLAGGAVYRKGSSWAERVPDFGNCLFKRNFSKGDGAAIAYSEADATDELEIRNCQFVENTGKLGAAIHAEVGRDGGGSLEIDQCFFNKNISGTIGGVIYVNNWRSLLDTKSVVIKNSKFSKELSHVDMIDIQIFGTSSSSKIVLEKDTILESCEMDLYIEIGGIIEINNTLIEKSSAGGALITLRPSTGCLVSNTSFTGNLSRSLLDVIRNNIFLTNVKIAENDILTGSPSGHYLFRARGTNMTMRNCTIKHKNNFIFCEESLGQPENSKMQINNTLISGSGKFIGYTFSGLQASTTLNHCWLDTTSFKCTAPPPSVICAAGNIFGTDPLFVAPDSGDYRLQSCSPLVNAGNNAYVPTTNTTDLAGQTRIQGGTVDIGAYEGETPVLTAIPTVQPACSNQPNGAVSLPVAGGCAPFSYQWATDSGQSGSGTSGLKSGTYIFTVSDQRGSTFTVSLAVPDSSTVALSSMTLPVQCGDTLGGTAIARATGGQPPYLFDWPGSIVMDSVQTDLPPGLYSVTVQDARGCTASAVAEVKKQGSLGSKVEVGEISCFGAADGSLTVLPVDGKPPYHWNWQESPALDAPMLAPLAPGAYRVTLTDAFGCDIAWTLPLTQPDPLHVLQSVIDPATDSMSADGSVSVTVTGGTTPYTAQWSNGSTGLSISGLKPDVYTLTVTDQNGCSFTASYVVDVVSGTSEPDRSEPGRLAGFSVLPNPTEAYLQILLTEPAETECLLSVLDAAGRLTGQWTLPAGTQQLRLNLGDLPAGMYWVQLRSERGTAMRRVVKQ